MSNFKWKENRAPVKRSFATAFQDQDEDGEEELSDSSHSGPAKREPLLHLEDPETRFKRLKAEGIALAGEERFWQAIHTWNQALEIRGEDAGVLDMKCQVQGVLAARGFDILRIRIEFKMDDERLCSHNTLSSRR